MYHFKHLLVHLTISRLSNDLYSISQHVTFENYFQRKRISCQIRLENAKYLLLTLETSQ